MKNLIVTEKLLRALMRLLIDDPETLCLLEQGAGEVQSFFRSVSLSTQLEPSTSWSEHFRTEVSDFLSAHIEYLDESLGNVQVPDHADDDLAELRALLALIQS
jgi:hypothetical protein